MSEVHYVVKFGKQKSGEAPYGQKDAYPIRLAVLAEGYRAFRAAGDTKGETVIETSYFALFDSSYAHFSHDMLEDLEAYMNKITTTKMERDTISLLEIATNEDSGNYKIIRAVEHPEALIGRQENDSYIITSDKATLSTIDKARGEATFKTEIDFKNRRVNGK